MMSRYFLPYVLTALSMIGHDLLRPATAAAVDGGYTGWSFTGNGRVQIQPYAGVNLVAGMAIGADGRIAIVEQSADRISDEFVNGVVCVVRLDANANYDYGFGPAHNGRVCLSDFTAIPSVLSVPGLHSIAIQSDGKIVIAVQMYQDVTASHVSTLVARLNADGTLDASAAGGAGFQYFQFSTTNGAYLSAAEAVSVRKDGKILVAGVACNDTSVHCNEDFGVARFDSELNFDATFGNNGRHIVNFDLGANDADSAIAVVADAANRTVLIGQAMQPGGKNGIAIVRLTDDGDLDSSFGTQGRFSSPLGGIIRYLTSGAIDEEGRILVAGAGSGPSGHDAYLVARVLADGSGVDIAFAGTAQNYAGSVQGAALFGFAPTVGLGTSEQGSDAFDIATQSDGRIVVTGQAAVADSMNTYNYFGVARLMPDNGALDASFGISGRAYGTFGASTDIAGGRAVAIAPGGLLMVAGSGADSPTSTTSDVGIAQLGVDLIFFGGFESPTNMSNQ